MHENYIKHTLQLLENVQDSTANIHDARGYISRIKGWQQLFYKYPERLDYKIDLENTVRDARKFLEALCQQ